MNLVKIYEEMVLEYNHGQGFTDKGLPYHTYVYLYNQELRKFREDINLLEIGVDHGGSLAMWKRYFKQYNIVGVDLHPNPIENMPYTEDLLADKNIHLRFGRSSTEPEVAAEFADNSFDVIIDDGSHDPDIQIETFKVWVGKTKRTGTYFIEDILEDAYDRVKKEVTQYTVENNIDCHIDDYLGDPSKLSRSDDKVLIIRIA